MRKSAFWRAGALALVAVLVLPTIAPGLAFATEAKHAALNGSLLIPTTAELNAFAHKGQGMSNFVEITTGDWEYSGGFNSDATARLLFNLGESLKLQLQANDNGFPARGLDYMFGGSSQFAVVSDWFYSSAQIFDLDVIGGSDMTWSVGASLGQSKDEVTTTDTTKDSTTGMGFHASVGNEKFDLGAEFSRASNSFEPGGGTSVDSSQTLFGVYGQYFMNMWQFIGTFGIGSSDDGSDTTADDAGLMAFKAGAGYHFENTDESHVVGQVYLQYAKTKDVYDADNNETADFTDFYVPGFEVAVDHAIGKRFRLYAAADATWAMMKTETTDHDNADAVTEEKTTDFFFDWTAGMGFSIFDNVQLDAVLQTNNLDQLLSLGNQEPLIGQISANVGF